MDSYHFTKKGDDYRLIREGAKRASVLFEGNKENAKKEAIEYMKDHGGSLKIHTNDGKIQEERTYPRSADPQESKG